MNYVEDSFTGGLLTGPQVLALSDDFFCIRAIIEQLLIEEARSATETRICSLDLMFFSFPQTNIQIDTQ
jgi:hypothetical protein